MFLLAYAMNFFVGFGNPLLMPLVPSIVANFALSPLDAGLLVSFYAIPGVCVLPVLGYLEDRFGRRPLLLFCLIASIISYLVASLAPSFGYLLFARILQGMSIAPMEALCLTLIADSYTGKEREKHIARTSSAMYLGGMTIPILSSLLLLWHWRAAFLVPIFLALIMLYYARKIPVHYVPPRHFSYFAQMKESLRSSSILSLFSVRILTTIVIFGTAYAYLALLLTDKMSFSAQSIALVFSTASFGMTTGGFLLPRLRFSPAQIAGLACLSLAAGLAIILFAPAPAFVWLGSFSYGLGYGSISSLTAAQLASKLSGTTKASIMSYYSVSFRLAQVLGPLLFGILFTFGSYEFIFLAGIISFLFLSVLCFVLFAKGIK